MVLGAGLCAVLGCLAGAIAEPEAYSESTLSLPFLRYWVLVYVFVGCRVEVEVFPLYAEYVPPTTTSSPESEMADIRFESV